MGIARSDTHIPAERTRDGLDIRRSCLVNSPSDLADLHVKEVVSCVSMSAMCSSVVKILSQRHGEHKKPPPGSPQWSGR